MLANQGLEALEINLTDLLPEALCNLDESKLQFLVANIRTTEGRQLAATHGVGHVTLLLFDASGQRRAVLAGLNESEYLTEAFRRHLAKFGNS